jgi:hypothetical protein
VRGGSSWLSVELVVRAHFVIGGVSSPSHPKPVINACAFEPRHAVATNHFSAGHRFEARHDRRTQGRAGAVRRDARASPGALIAIPLRRFGRDGQTKRRGGGIAVGCVVDRLDGLIRAWILPDGGVEPYFDAV